MLPAPAGPMTWNGHLPVGVGSNQPKSAFGAAPGRTPTSPGLPVPAMSTNIDCSQLRVPISCDSQVVSVVTAGIPGFFHQKKGNEGRVTSMASTHPSPSTSYGYSAQSPSDMHV